jgi:hypothetical protein
VRKDAFVALTPQWTLGCCEGSSTTGTPSALVPPLEPLLKTILKRPSPHELLYGGKLGHDPLETNQKPPAWLFHDHPTSGVETGVLMCLQ